MPTGQIAKKTYATLWTLACWSLPHSIDKSSRRKKIFFVPVVESVTNSTQSQAEKVPAETL
jgi:hypothetical protein